MYLQYNIYSAMEIAMEIAEYIFTIFILLFTFYVLVVLFTVLKLEHMKTFITKTVLFGDNPGSTGAVTFYAEIGFTRWVTTSLAHKCCFGFFERLFTLVFSFISFEPSFSFLPADNSCVVCSFSFAREMISNIQKTVPIKLVFLNLLPCAFLF